jgi:hypothetical protein
VIRTNIKDQLTSSDSSSKGERGGGEREREILSPIEASRHGEHKLNMVIPHVEPIG